MKRKTFTITVEHHESLFPDEGALLAAINRALYSRHAWFGPDQPGIMTVHLAEVQRGPGALEVPLAESPGPHVQPSTGSQS